MAELSTTIPAAGDLRPRRDDIDAARRVVAGHAADVDDLKALLSALGLLDTKVCGTCHTEKPLSQFGRAPGRWDGREGRCSTCKSAAIEARKEARRG